MSNNLRIPEKPDEVFVVGSGLAGLVCALALAPRPVTLITKTMTLAGGSSLWAQGGIAAAIGPADSPQSHAADTLSAGAGLSDPERVRQLTEESVESLQWLVEQGIPFDRTLSGALALAQEAAHRVPRVVHAGGDATGLVLMRSLIERVTETNSITVLTDTFVHDLVVRDGQIQGLVAFSSSSGWTYHRTPNIVLATGGIGTIWYHTTNPLEASGDGLAMAARAGATLTDLEFVQFHPTAFAADTGQNGSSLPLLTEALRGAGAVLLDEAGCRIMLAEHAAAEMAPRDVIARAIHQRTSIGQGVFLDLRPVISAGLAHSFPRAMAVARKAGFDPSREALPITPAAHYHMGGVQVDERGRTSINGLWACGEVAATGVHGANRLASNSLLEALVYARRVADDIGNIPARRYIPRSPAPMVPGVPSVAAEAALESISETTRALMSRHVGIERSGADLETAHARLRQLERRLTELGEQRAPDVAPLDDLVGIWGETRNRLLVARLITLAALRREESRGAHHRDDFPESRLAWQHRQTMTAQALLEAY